MALKSVLEAQVRSILTDGKKWETENARVVPAVADVGLATNHAKFFDAATVLYADLDGSTDMVNVYPWWFSAEIYKAYLKCAGKILKESGGVVTAYDGDRVMAVFIGQSKDEQAVRAALRINWALAHIINPEIKKRWPSTDFVVKHVVGIDTSPLRAVRIGVHNDNDLVWVGRAANYAAKLCAFGSKPIWITSDVYAALPINLKVAGINSVWEKFPTRWAATKKHSIDVYSSIFAVPLT